MAKLLRRKHPQTDLFIADIFDCGLKDLHQELEHPLFSLSKKPDTKIRYYEAPNGDYIKFTPSVLGIANIFDKDILIFAISQLIHQINNGGNPTQTIRFSARDLLIATNKGLGGKDYISLKNSFKRLKGTVIETCIETGDQIINEGFGMIDYWRIVRKTKEGRMEGLELKLSDWLYNGILAKEVLSLNSDYFLISSPLERRIYEICRKHCGHQTKWCIKLENLHLKTGSQSHKDRFKQYIKKIIADQNILDYKVSLKDDLFIVEPKAKVLKPKNLNLINLVSLRTQTITNAKKIIGRHFDIYALQSEYSEWIKNKPKPTKGYDAGFIGFCKKKAGI